MVCGWEGLGKGRREYRYRYLRTRVSGTWWAALSGAILDISLLCRRIRSTTYEEGIVSDGSMGGLSPSFCPVAVYYVPGDLPLVALKTGMQNRTSGGNVHTVSNFNQQML